MKYIWAFLAALSLAGLVLFFWHSQTKSNPTPPKPETTQTASSEKSDKQPTPTDDIVSEEYSVSYADKQLYGKITAPSDYKSKKLPTMGIAHGFNNTLEQYEMYSQLLFFSLSLQAFGTDGLSLLLYPDARTKLQPMIITV